MGCDCSDGMDACDLSTAYLVPLHNWQRDVLKCWLASDGGGYASRTCGLIVPRQNGKTQLIAARILYGLLFANPDAQGIGQGEVIHYSAHRVDTTLEMFQMLVSVLGDPRKPESEWRFPDLHAEVESITFTNGMQRIYMRNGANVRFTARSTGSGRGSSMDVQIYDEAGFLTDDQLSALLSTQSAAPHGNPQTIYAGTPPSERGIYAEPFSRARQNAIAKAEGVCWHEWSVSEPGNVSDMRRVKACNPSYGLNLLPESVKNELAQFSPEKFAIERLCWWPDTASAKAVNPVKWEQGAWEPPADFEFGKRTLGAKFSSDGERVCVAVCAVAGDGWHVELVFDEPTYNGVQWLVDWLAGRGGEYAAIWIDGKAGATDLAQRTTRAGWARSAVRVMRSGEVVTAARTMARASRCMTSTTPRRNCGLSSTTAMARGRFATRIAPSFSMWLMAGISAPNSSRGTKWHAKKKRPKVGKTTLFPLTCGFMSGRGGGVRGACSRPTGAAHRRRPRARARASARDSPPGCRAIAGFEPCIVFSSGRGGGVRTLTPCGGGF